MTDHDRLRTRTALFTAALLACAAAACHDEPAGATTASAAAPTPPGAPVEVAAPSPPSPSPLEQVLKATTIGDAIDRVRPQLDDEHDQHSAGTLLLTAWAAHHLRWSDVAVTKNETSFALVRKDVDAARGRRMCASGQVIEIARDSIADGTFFHGLLMTYRQDLLSFQAVASTGELVEMSPARFCGVVTGRFDYSNSAGGTGHAVDMVGMFDLPDNRAP
ncbi:MAG TPA: hypothetical protein VHE35_36730 [Kofleriaceae bacterium]|nr:hypothetical protein [Kofleriaceae bacterium]